MAYLGNQPVIGAYHKLDAISTVNGQATYNLLLDSVAFTPQSANHMLVVVNGIVQSPTTNYTISGSTITFTGNLVTGDVINEIRVFGDILNIGTPSDATVTNAKTNFVSTSSAAGLSIKGDGTTDGTVQLNCSQNSHGVKIASPAHSSGQSYTIKLPTENIAADKIMKVASISGSGTTAIGQMSFVDEPEGGLVLLSATTVSSASSIDFNSSLITSTYKVYEIYGNIFYATASNGTGTVRYSTDNGSTMNSTSNVHYAHNTISAGTTSYRGSHSGTELSMVGVHVISQSTTVPLTFRLTIFNPMGTEYTGIESKASYYNGSSYGMVQTAGHIATNTAINFIRIISTNGNYASGFVNLYGRKSS